MAIQKTLALVLVAGVSASAASANNGFYVGGDLGYSRTNLHEKVTITNNNQTGKGKVSKTRGSMDMGVNFGYMHNINNFLIGAETGLGYSFSKPTTVANSVVGGANAQVKASFKRGFTSDLIAKLGMKFGKTSVYGLGGLTFAQFKFNENIKFSNATTSASSKTSKSKTLTGKTFGLGLTQDISEKVAIKAEYRHTTFGKLSATKTVAFNNQTSSAKMSIKPTSDAFIVGAVYKF